MDAYQGWQYQLERQPFQFIVREMLGELENARQILGRFLNASADDLVFVPNVTFGVNIIARSLQLKSGDEILASDHEYGACENIWTFMAQKTGAAFIRQSVPLPLGSPEEVADQLWQGVTPRTKVIFLSHITSPTAIKFPIKEICARAREAGILTIVDGAHAPGQIPLHLAELGADLYTGACHKWLCAPKGASFLYARPEVKDTLEPLVVSWGWGAEQPGTSRFVDYHEWQGTRDIAAFLSVPAAIEFQHKYRWDEVRRRCIELAAETRDRLIEIFRTARLTQYQGWALQMAAVELPEPNHNIQRRLREEHNIEVLVHQWHKRSFMRFSFQGYNDLADADSLIDAVQTLYA